VYIARKDVVSTASLTYAGFFFALYLGAHLVVRFTVPYADPYLLPIVCLLTAIGLTEIYRLNPDDAVKQAGWIVVNDTVLPLVCVTHDDIRSGRCTVADLVRAIQARGRVWISDVVLGRREPAVRACITSFRTEHDDLDVLVDELERARTSRS